MNVKLYTSLPYAYNKVGFLDGIPHQFEYPNITAYEGIGTERPHIMIQTDSNITNAVACVITGLHGSGARPYLVTNITVVRNGLFRLDLKFAPIAFRSNLTGLKGILNRSQTKWDKTVPDNMMAVQQARQSYYKKFPNSFTSTQQMILVISGPHNNWAQT